MTITGGFSILEQPMNAGMTDFKKIANLLKEGFYKVKESGEFIEAVPGARKLFGLPPDTEKADLSEYSITDIYISPDDRKLRIDNLKKSSRKPVLDVLSLRVNGKSTLLFSICWYNSPPMKTPSISGIVADFEDRIIFPKIFDELPMGIYELDDDNRFVRVNQRALEIFGFGKDSDLIGRNIEDFYLNPEDMKKFSIKVSNDGLAQEVLKFKNADDKILEIKCFSKHIKNCKNARWGFMLDVTQRERYYRGLDQLPTAYYYIEYSGKKKHRGKIVLCNDYFAKILGVASKKKLLGRDINDFYVSQAEGNEYFKRLEELDKKGMPILNLPFKLRRQDNGNVVHVTIDSHLLKEGGKIIGREGTLRDISDEVELKQKVEETEKRLHKTTADINNLIHTFLHPVIKFAGNAELFKQVGEILYQTIQPEKCEVDNITTEDNARDLGQMMMNKLKDICDKFPDLRHDIEYDPDEKEKMDALAKAVDLKDTLSRIINHLDYPLKEEESNILLDRAVRDTALMILEELRRVGYFKHQVLEPYINKGFVTFLQGILFKYITKGTGILVGETEIMKREVEALRKYIGMKKKRTYFFSRHDVGRLLEESLELFTPVLLEKDITISYKRSGNLDAEISRNDLERVIYNLLHNVRKYGYADRTVKIKAKEIQPGNSVEFYIESYGIPIKKDEIDTGQIWEFGFRSQLAYSSDRDGTGVGLADAKDVVEAHDGTIRLESRPAKNDSEPPEYDVPYITRLTVSLPKRNMNTDKV